MQGSSGRDKPQYGSRGDKRQCRAAGAIKKRNMAAGDEIVENKENEKGAFITTRMKWSIIAFVWCVSGVYNIATGITKFDYIICLITLVFGLVINAVMSGEQTE